MMINMFCNIHDPITLEKYDDIPEENLIKLSINNKLCFYNVATLYEWCKINPSDPLTKTKFSNSQIKKIKKQYNNSTKQYNKKILDKFIDDNFDVNIDVNNIDVDNLFVNDIFEKSKEIFIDIKKSNDIDKIKNFDWKTILNKDDGIYNEIMKNSCFSKEALKMCVDVLKDERLRNKIIDLCFNLK